MAETLTISQAARALDLSVRRVRDLIAEGKLECEHTPLGRLLSAKSVEELRAARAAGR